uniref:Uncharacterized protein n=1 Tax=Oryza barthii TaxID=65489 RepID=A0A0D3G062_9ORYZ
MQESGGCPYIHFRLYEDCQRMTSSYVQMVSDIKRHVSHLAAAENQGVVPIISAGQIFPGPAAGEAYCKYKTLVLPSVPNHNMHFVVVLHTPPNWAGGTREPRSMLRTVVSISEAVRFRELLTRIVMGFAAGLYGPTLQPWVMPWPSLVPNTPTPRIFTTAFDDDHFKNWDVYCKLARAGAQASLQGREDSPPTRASLPFWGRAFIDF